MLKQNTTESSDPPAAQTRVKREEFARAISALEARRQEEASYLEGTVSVEDTLRELQVDVSTEEVMRQIEAQRAGHPVEKRPRLVWDRDKIVDLKLVGGIVLVPLLAVLFGAMLYHPSARPSPMMGSVPVIGSPPVAEVQTWISPEPVIQAGITGAQMDEGGFNASSVLKPLSQVANDQPVHCNSGSLQMLLSSYYRLRLNRPSDPQYPPGTRDPRVLAQTDQLFDVRPTLRKPWTLIKHKGCLYLRAWVPTKFTQEQAQNHVLRLHSSSGSLDPGVQPVQITLPLSFVARFTSFRSFQFDRSAAPSLSAIRVSLDQHAWEKW